MRSAERPPSGASQRPRRRSAGRAGPTLGPRSDATPLPQAQRATQWSLYLVRCRDGSLYTGIATDVARRLARHAQGAGLGAKYLRGRGPLELVLERRVGAHGLALRVEHRVKRLSKADKEALLTDRRAIGALIARAKKRPAHRAANRPSS